MRRSSVQQMMDEIDGPEDTLRMAETVREAERRDIARELHDTVIQPLATLVAGFDRWEHQPMSPGMIEAYLGAWKELAQEALDSLRCTLAGMHAHPHAQLGLPDALRRFLAPHLRSRGLRVTLESRDWPPDVPVDVTSSLYLTVREALTNVDKHAHATEVTVLLQADEDSLSVYIADNGVGFREDDLPPRQPGSGFGLVGMRERVQLLSGQFSLITASGRGVQLEIRLPFSSHVESRAAELSVPVLYATTIQQEYVH